MKTERIVLGLPGLKCAPCVPDIEVAVRSVDGVIWAILNYAAEELTIIFDPSVVGSAALLKRVQRLGVDPSLVGVRIEPELLGPRARWSTGAVQARPVAGHQERARS